MRSPAGAAGDRLFVVGGRAHMGPHFNPGLWSATKPPAIPRPSFWRSRTGFGRFVFLSRVTDHPPDLCQKHIGKCEITDMLLWHIARLIFKKIFFFSQFFSQVLWFI